MSAVPASARFDVADTDDAAPLAYALRWRTRGVRPGAHRGRMPSALGEGHDVVPFAQSPDARRIDLRQSLRDPFGQLHVRRFRQPSAVDVAVLLDTSGSMGFRGRMHAREVAARLCAALAWAARQAGDAFGLGLGGETLGAGSFAPTRAAPAPTALLERLRALPAAGAHAHGLVEAAQALGARRSLVFVVSDFLFPEALGAELFDALAAHEIVPVCLQDSAQEHIPAWGIAELRDLESGRRRLLLLRPRLRAAWRAERAARRARFQSLCAERGVRPFFMRDRLDLDGLGEHLLAG